MRDARCVKIDQPNPAKLRRRQVLARYEGVARTASDRPAVEFVTDAHIASEEAERTGPKELEVRPCAALVEGPGTRDRERDGRHRGKVERDARIVDELMPG